MLQISVGAGEPYAIVDGLMWVFYTYLYDDMADAVNDSRYTKSSDNTPSSPIPSDNAAPLITDKTGGTNSALSWAASHRTIIIGVGVGVGVLLLILVSWRVWPKKKQPQRHAEVNVKVPV